MSNSTPSATPAPSTAKEILDGDIQVLRKDPFDGLVDIELPSCPIYACPAAAPEPGDATPVVQNEGERELRVRASILSSGAAGEPAELAALIRVELDVDARTYPSCSHLPRLWVRSDLAGVNRDGSMVDEFYDAVKSSPGRKRNPIETILWHFSNNFLRDVSVKETKEIHLRFRVGDEVLANVGQWEQGKVIALWDEGYPYRIRLEKGDMEVHAPFDSDEAVRALVARGSNATEEGTKEPTWPESAKVPRHAWAHNLRQWQKARALSKHPLEESFFSPGESLDWWAKWLHPDLLSWLRKGEEGRPDFIEELSPGIFAFQLFTLDFCEKFLDEVERCEKIAADRGIDISRPNSMNRGGAIMSELGLTPLMNSLQDYVLQRLARCLFPTVGAELTLHHSFVVKYSRAEDRQLDMHTDDSDITFNICLGKEFRGSGLQFCGLLGSPKHRKKTLRYHHKLGHCVVHLGAQRHGADIIEAGERVNLISWNRNKVWRRSSGYLHALHQIDYKRESSPPDPVCLSWTHDVDWERYRDARPSGHVRPWCPPVFARHDHPNEKH